MVITRGGVSIRKGDFRFALAGYESIVGTEQ